MEYKSHVDSMCNALETVINEHMKKILCEYDEKNKEMNQVMSFLQELPFVKDLINENNKLKKDIISLEEKVSSYEVCDEQEGIKLEIKDREDCDIKSIRLDNSDEYLSHISNLNNGLMNSYNNFEFDSKDEIQNSADKEYDSFVQGVLLSKKNDDDKNEEGTSIIETILKAQEAGEYATIDTASDEEDENEKLINEAIAEHFDDEDEDDDDEDEDDVDEDDEDDVDEDDEDEDDEDDDEDEDDEDEDVEEDDVEDDVDEDDVEEDDDDEDDVEDEEDDVVDEEDEEDDKEEQGKRLVEDDDKEEQGKTLVEDDEDDKEEQGKRLVEDEEADKEEHGKRLVEDEEDVEEEEEEVEEIEIDGNDYFTDDKINGNIYECLEDGDPGDKVGWFENSIAFFS
jgi:HIV Tat-specific factor 1